MDYQTIRINFCQNLRHLRKVHNLTQVEMAGRLEISVGKLRKIEKVDQRVRLDSRMLCRVCDCFDISSDEILRQNWPEILAERFNGQ